uniref:Uncharacterized protein n=1 Tax=Chromera velia CCMP2878 TaxID=1169474 RepID=A0A0G4FYV5_9ALVE|eukprot:Cvel_19332.t1-p1 / transcript=Cvel_19332.t1 / gene=Cvel_19332 / organism=Chromera_velia_CCMP2878 / gene_product=hypothetical protein / transcript_product=hypothetical protein / location=Cvel_scaffold1659:17836-18480(+) / protein_length=215 / sequence_SO=supercontig / SO=protein_coding / is_pseudo=false
MDSVLSSQEKRERKTWIFSFAERNRRKLRFGQYGQNDYATMAKNKTFVKIQRGHHSKEARVEKFLEYVLDREKNPWYVPSNLPAPSFLDRLNQLRQAKDEAAEAKLSGQEAKAAADKAAAEAFQLHQFGRKRKADERAALLVGEMQEEEEKEEGGEVYKERGNAALRLKEAHPIKKCKKEEVEEKEPEAPLSVTVPARVSTGSSESVVCTYDMVQ